MKKNILLSLAILLSTLVYGQDIIVTKKADTIACKINKVFPKTVLYSFENSNGSIINSELDKEDLVAVYFDYNPSTKSGSRYINFNRKTGVFFIGLTIGPSIRLGSVTSRADPTIENSNAVGLLTSFQLGYFKSKKTGIGLTYANRRTNYTYGITPLGTALYEKINLRYVALTFFFKHLERKKFTLQSDFSLGLLRYKNSIESGSALYSQQYSGNTLGLGGNLNAVFQLTRTFRISLSTGALVGKASIKLENNNQSFFGPREELLATFDTALSVGFLLY